MASPAKRRIVPPIVGTALLAGGLAAVHVLAGRLRSLRVAPRSRWLSLAGGISVAYVFVHVLPEIADRQSRLAVDDGSSSVALSVAREHTLFVVVLVGFAAFYGLEQFVQQSRRRTDRQAVVGDAETRTSTSAFWIHIGSFASYNALVGYLLRHRGEAGVSGLVLYFVAMALHFLVNDSGLREHHRDAYDHVGRWILAAAVLAGLAAGYLVTVPETLLSLLFALLAGGVVLNVIKEELPEDRESRFWAFATGAAAYTVVLLSI